MRRFYSLAAEVVDQGYIILLTKDFVGVTEVPQQAKVPAANPEWIQPFSYLECGDLMRGVEALAQEREKWLTRWV